MHPTRPLHILVVDDESDLVHSTVELLSLHGLSAAGATSGRQALDAAADRRPDVVLLDLAMPMVDGYEVARRLRDDRVGRPPIVIAVTGISEALAGDRALATGFHHYLTKPVPPAALLEVLGVCERAVALGGTSDDTTTLPGA